MGMKLRIFRKPLPEERKYEHWNSALRGNGADL